MSYHFQDTICALATPQGIGAIGVIRVSGAQTFPIVNQLFKGKNLLEQPSHTIHFGTLRDGDDIVDEVLVSLFRGPRSYTREDVIELSCHGSDFIIRRILKLLLKNGCRMAKPGEFTQRAFLNGQMDLTQAEAVADLIASDSEATHRSAINQIRGGFSRQLAQLREKLVHFASMIELELDFAEEDVEFASRAELTKLVLDIQRVVLPLIESFDYGNAIKNGIPTVIVGKPNAGKSTLLNCLLNEEKAIVSEIAGTTRDVIEDELIIEGIRFRLIDTAGLRKAEDKIEAIGVERTHQQIEKADLVIYLFDASTTSGAHLEEVKMQYEEMGKKYLLVGNKADLLTSPPVPLLQGEELTLPFSRRERRLGGEVTVQRVPTELLANARALRKNQTKAEEYLWAILRNRQFKGLKFRRQHPLIGNYILDFYNTEFLLGIELDGGIHKVPAQAAYDENRTREIEDKYKISIIRFTNEEVLNNIEVVLSKIDALTSPPTPLLQGEGSMLPLPRRERAAADAGLESEVLFISAAQNQGINELKAQLVKMVSTHRNLQADTVITNLRHYEHLVKTNESLEAVLRGVEKQITSDWLAFDLRQALNHLGEITGSITTDDLLANIFSKFCIGK